jgi:hypothetical protein
LTPYDAGFEGTEEGDTGIVGMSGRTSDGDQIHEPCTRAPSPDRLYNFDSDSDSGSNSESNSESNFNTNEDHIELFQQITGHPVGIASQTSQEPEQLHHLLSASANMQAGTPNPFLSDLQRSCKSKPTTLVQRIERMAFGSPGMVHRYDTIPHPWALTDSMAINADDDVESLYSPFKSEVDFQLASWLKRFNISREAGDEIIKTLKVLFYSHLSISFQSAYILFINRMQALVSRSHR